MIIEKPFAVDVCDVSVYNMVYTKRSYITEGNIHCREIFDFAFIDIPSAVSSEISGLRTQKCHE